MLKFTAFFVFTFVVHAAPKTYKPAPELSCEEKQKKSLFKNTTSQVVCEAQELANALLLAPEKRGKRYQSETNHLKEIYKKLHENMVITDHTFKDALKISIREDENCFFDDGTWFSDRDLEAQWRKESLMKLVRSLALLGRELFIQSQGDLQGWIFGLKEIEVCAKDMEEDGKNYRLEYTSGGKLKVFPSFEYLSAGRFLYLGGWEYLNVPTMDQLLADWNEGKHIFVSKNSSTNFRSMIFRKQTGFNMQEIIQKYWWLIDPAGFVAPKIKATLKRVLKNFNADITKSLAAGTLGKEDLYGLLQRHIDIERFERKNSWNLKSILETLSQQERKNLLNDLQKEVNSHSHQNALIRSMLSQSTSGLDLTFENEQEGSVNVANLHAFNILLNFGQPQNSFTKYLEAPKRSILIRNKQTNPSRKGAKFSLEGKVKTPQIPFIYEEGGQVHGKLAAEAVTNVFTIDLLALSVSINIDGAMESVALEKVLKKFARQ